MPILLREAHASSSEEGLPKKERRRSSLVRQNVTQNLKQIALLRNTSDTAKRGIFLAKLDLCKVTFNFDDAASNVKGKELKRQTLLELVDFINSDLGQKFLSDVPTMVAVIEMISSNIFRALSPQTDEFDPEEDEPVSFLPPFFQRRVYN